MTKNNQKHIGSNFNDFLQSRLMLDEATAVAHKRIIAFQIKNAMMQKHFTKSDMASKMHTSRSAIDRLLNPDNPSVTLSTIDRAASVLGMKLNISLI